MSDRVRAIEPGSISYGERQGVEAALTEQGPAAAGPTVGPAPAGPPGAPPAGDDITPEAMLQEGAVSDLPVTSGLDVGPGPGPFQGIAATSEQRRLQEIALQAPSAGLRYMAALALRRIHAKQKQGR